MAAKKRLDQMWTIKEMKRLEALRMEGLSRLEVASTLGRSVGSVIGKLQTMEIHVPLKAHFWVELIHSGKSDSELAKVMNCNETTVRTRRSRLRKLGYNLPDRRRN